MPSPYFRPTSSGTRPVPANLSVAKPNGTNTASLTVATGWPTSGTVDIIMYAVDTSNAEVVGSKTTWRATISGTSLSAMVLVAGVEPTTGYAGGSSTVVKMGVTSSWADDMVAGIKLHANDDGSLKTTAVQTALGLGTATLNGWNALGYAPNTVVYNGNRSYTLTFNGVDLTPTLSAGMRLRTTRTVAAPTQSTSLNGTSQYFSKTAPAGMTFTNNFVAGAWVKLTSYSATRMTIISRYNGTSGWEMSIFETTGQIILQGFNAGVANRSYVLSSQSIPLNKWVHVAAQLDMSTFTASPTTSYIMIDGVDVPTSVARGGTAPTALVQAGNLEVGSQNSGTLLFPGKIAQAFVYSAKVTQATIQATIPQGLAGTETNLISAYSFNNSINDLNTTNANNLTANGSAVATATDSPFGGQAGGTISSTLDYGIVQATAFSTNSTTTVQVPEGCTIPTSGGVSAVVYSSNGKPYGMPTQRSKWRINSLLRTNIGTTSNANYGSYNSGGWGLSLPLGSWKAGWRAGIVYNASTTLVRFLLTGTDPTGLGASGLPDNSFVVGLQSSTAAATVTPFYCEDTQEVSTQTTYKIYSIGATTAAGIDGTTGQAEIFAENAYL